MASSPDSIIYKNVLHWRGCEKLYLDARTADVHFVFDSEDGESERIPAHKNILSAISPFFDAMFYGEMKQNGDINIVDTPTEAFKEFLQFFYRSTVKLTAENVFAVMNLGKQHMLNECFKACTNLTKETLTKDNVCLGYERAILFEDDDLKRLCEQTISEHAEEVFRSDGFLSCEPNLLRHILMLDSLKCTESVVFDGLMAWAKAACVRKGLDEPSNTDLRSQLGDFIYEICFGEMKMEDFYVRYSKHEGLFSAEEFKCIMGMIASKEFPSGRFNPNPRKIRDHGEDDVGDGIMVCNRVDLDQSYSLNSTKYLETSESTIFTTNRTLLLKRLHFSEFVTDLQRQTLLASLQIYRMNSSKVEGLWYSAADIECRQKTIIEIPKPIVVTENNKYCIVFTLVRPPGYESKKDNYTPRVSDMSSLVSVSAKNCLSHKPEVCMEDGVIITFHDMVKSRFIIDGHSTWISADKRYGLLTQLDFQKYTKAE